MKIDHINKNCEVGVTIGDKDYWGKIHGKEALKLTMDYLFFQLNMQTIYITVLEENERSIHFFKKFGFVQNGLHATIYSIPQGLHPGLSPQTAMAAAQRTLQMALQQDKLLVVQ